MTDKKKAETIVSNTAASLTEKKTGTPSIETIIKVAGLILAMGTIFFSYRTYMASEKWKKAEFTSAKFKEFSINKSVSLANEMLDYHSRLFPLLNQDSLVGISDDVLYSALIIDTANSDFSETETKVRDIFDEYFDQLSLFNRYAKTNLIKYEEIKPYIEYQASIIADTTNTRKENLLRLRIWDYINYYGFKDVKELYTNIGYSIK